MEVASLQSWAASWECRLKASEGDDAADLRGRLAALLSVRCEAAAEAADWAALEESAAFLEAEGEGIPTPAVAVTPGLTAEAAPVEPRTSQLKPPLPFEKHSAERREEAAGEAAEERPPPWVLTHIDCFEFDFVPKYMKGRITLDQVNAVLAGFNAAFDAKYELLGRKFAPLSKAEKNKVLAYREHETDQTKGLKFVVESSVKAALNVKDQPLLHKVVPILRHCGRLREVRGKGLIRFVANPNS